MPRLDAPAAPHRLGSRARGAVAPALLVGLAVGAGLVGGSGALARLFGAASAAVITLGTVWAAALAWGAHRSLRPGDDVAGGSALTLGARLLLLGALSVLGAFAFGGSRLLGWVGAGVDAGPLGDALARAVIGGAALVPAGFLAGSALQRGARLLPEGAGAARAAAAGVAAATLAALLVQTVTLCTPKDPTRVAAGVAGGLLILAGVIVRRREPAHEGAVGDAPSDTSARADLFPLVAAFAIAFGLGAYRFLGARVFRFAFADELPGMPVPGITFATGIAAGAILAALLAPRLRATLRGSVAALLAALAAVSATFLLGRYAAIPAAFVAATAHAAHLDDVLRAALELAAPRTAPPGLLLGAAAAVLAAALPEDRERRGRWIARVAAGAAIGFVLGSAVARLSLRPFGLDATLHLSGAIVAVLAGAAVALGELPLPSRAPIAIALPLLAILVARALPPTNRQGLFLDQNLLSRGGVTRPVQKHWTELDLDDDALSVAVMRRGHARRLLVDGRFDSSNDTSPKSQGMLAELPLAFHGAAKRVLIVGAGSGWAAAVAEAHSVDRVDLFAPARAAVMAAEHMGPVPRLALTDPRLHVHLGDPEDLLARAAPYDVVLLQPSGGWTERSARFATAEFLRLVRARLSGGGLACLWVPESALTREGFLILLATWANVFPRVEAWAGQDGDVLLLANRDEAPHDFGRVMAAYRDGHVAAACRASWIATPETLLSQFLLSDRSVRRLAATRTPSTRENGALERVEAERRSSEPTVDPVPGLAAIRDDVVATLVGTPGEGFAPAIAQAVRARDLEWKGVDLELAGKPLDATDAYRAAIALNPHDGAIRRAFATLRSQQGIEYGTRQSFIAAHAYMREAVETDTTYAEGFANLGFLLAQAEDFDYAIACTGQAMSLAPDDDLFQLQMGRIWKQRGYYDKALPFYQAAMDLNPRNVEAGIGYVDAKLAMQGSAADLAWGLRFLEKYRAIDPHHEDLLYRIGKLKDVLAKRAKGGADSAATIGPRTPPAPADTAAP
ncbi:MAG: hypothetical protein U0167_05635 [bacterium]